MPGRGARNRPDKRGSDCIWRPADPRSDTLWNIRSLSSVQFWPASASAANRRGEDVCNERSRKRRRERQSRMFGGLAVLNAAHNFVTSACTLKATLCYVRTYLQGYKLTVCNQYCLLNLLESFTTLMDVLLVYVSHDRFTLALSRNQRKIWYMKPVMQDRPILVPRKECDILNLIRNDHELIERLRITPEELDALSKCALFGTLTCKQDMLFILRQIRAAGRPRARWHDPVP